jgi:uncharacterized RDD family membrane protein YckC
MLVDHIIMCFLGGFLGILVLNVSRNTQLIGGTVILMMICYICKDCFNGQSPAKRIFNLKVVDNQNGEIATPLQCIVRMLTLPIWPIEVIVTLFNPVRRLGDRLAGTKVVSV